MKQPIDRGKTVSRDCGVMQPARRAVRIPAPALERSRLDLTGRGQFTRRIGDIAAAPQVTFLVGKDCAVMKVREQAPSNKVGLIRITGLVPAWQSVKVPSRIVGRCEAWQRLSDQLRRSVDQVIIVGSRQQILAILVRLSTAAGICTGAAAQKCTTGSVVACPRSPWEGPARGATRPRRGWRRPARGRGLWAHGVKRGVIRTVAGVVTGSA